MKIFARHTHIPEVDIIEFRGFLTEDTVGEIKKYLYSCLERGIHNMLMDFTHVREIDRKVIKVLGDFGNDVRFRFFNVEENIRWQIRRSGRYDVFKKVYDGLDEAKVLSLFEKDILKKRQIKKGRIERRSFPRSINISIPAEFNYIPNKDRMVTGSFTILNISESGAYVGDIKLTYRLTGRVFYPQQISGQKLYNVKFSLYENMPVIEVGVRCIRDTIIRGELLAGISFRDLSEEGRNMIMGFVSSNYDLGKI